MRPLLALLVLSFLAACSDTPRRKVGDNCTEDVACETGLCGGGVCLDPEVDTDADGLINGLEVAFGSDPLRADTDGDGRRDRDELAEDLGLTDTDGDGRPDIVDSATADADGDCIPDQLDAREGAPDSDLSPLVAEVCPSVGLCRDKKAGLRVDCSTGTPRCVFDDVDGYESPEVTCDGVDQNCDGVADDGMPDRDADGLADCVDRDWDNDGVADAEDACPTLANAGSADVDADGDGVGDACASRYGLRFKAAPARVTAGAPFQVEVVFASLAADGAPEPRFEGVVTLSLEGEGALGGDLTARAVAGAAIFSGLTLDRVTTGLRLVARAGGLADGRSDAIEVVAAEADSLAIEGLPREVVAGEPLRLLLVARDAAGNVATGYRGTVRFEATDPLAELPLPVIFAMSDAGQREVSGVTFATAGAGRLVAADGELLAEAEVEVLHGPAARLEVSGPAAVRSGDAFDVAVTARDAWDNLAEGYAGTVSVTSSDARALTPSPHPFGPADRGVHVFRGLRILTGGAQRIELSDGVQTARLDVVVSAAGAASLDVTASREVVAGEPFFVDVTVRDAAGNVVDGGPQSFAIDLGDGPLRFELPGGQGALGPLVLTRAEVVSLSVTSLDAPLSRTLEVAVSPGPAAALALELPAAPVSEREAFSATVVAHDAWENVATGYRGLVAFEADDPEGGVPPPVAFGADDAGQRRVDGFLARTVGAQAFGASDGILSASGVVEVACGEPASLAIEGLSATATAGAPTPTFDLVLRDASGDVCAPGDVTVRLASDDPRVTFQDAGVGRSGRVTRGGLTFETAGARTLNASLPEGLGSTARVDVAPAAAASLAMSLPEASLAAGVGTTATVEAHDRFGNRATGYRGTVRFSSSDPAASLPPERTFSADDAGRHDFNGLTFRTVGARTVTVTDTRSAALTASAQVSVTAGASVVLVITGAPTAPVTAGSGFGVTIEARDPSGNALPGYRGTVRFSASDTLATLPPEHTFAATDAGRKVFPGVVLRSSGSVTLRVTDVNAAPVTASVVVPVAAGPASSAHLSCGPARPIAGVSVACSMDVRDAFGNRASSFRGTVTVSASDPTAVLPASWSFTASDAGVAQFPSGVTLKRAGPQTITATSGALSASASLEVLPAGATSFVVAGLAPDVVAGSPQSLVATALDAFGNTATGYNGSATVTSTDAQVTVASPLAFSAGVRSFGVTLRTAGAQSVTLTSGPVTGRATTTVSAGPEASLRLTGLPANVTAGADQTVVLTVLDAWGNRVTGFVGEVALAATGGSAPATLALTASDEGTKPFQMTFTSAGPQTLTATAGVGAARVETIVDHGPASQVVLSGLPATRAAGEMTPVFISVQDAFGNLATRFVGVIGLSVDAGDPLGSISPTSITFNGAGGVVAPVSVTLRTAGTRTLTAQGPGFGATATTNVLPASAATLVLSAAPSQVAGVPFTVSVAVRDIFGNVATDYLGRINFATDDPSEAIASSALPAAYQFTAADRGARTFPEAVTLFTAGSRSVSVSDAAEATLTGSTAVQLAPADDAASLVFVEQPGPGLVARPLSPAPVVELRDPWGNRLAASGTTVTLQLPRNPGRTLWSPLTAATVAGRAVFDAAVVDRPGAGYVLAASTPGVDPALSAPFEVRWAAPTVEAVVFPAGAGACVDVAWTAAHADGAAVDLRVEYAVAEDDFRKWRPATQAAGGRPLVASDPRGTSAIRLEAQPSARVFRWNAQRDLQSSSPEGVKVRVTAIAGEAEASRESAELAWDAGWKASWRGQKSTEALVHATLADLDEDGRLDLVSVASGNGNALFSKGDGAGGFAGHQPLSFGLRSTPNPWRVAVGDLDADGRPDVVISDRLSPRVVVGIGGRHPELGALTLAGLELEGVCDVGDVVEAMAIANSDADAAPELHLVCPASGKVAIYGHTPNGFILERTIATPRAPYAVAVADLDHDGARELLIGQADGLIEVHADGALVEALNLPTQEAIIDLAVGDVDRDGLLDVAAAHGSPAIPGEGVAAGQASWLLAFGALGRNPAGVVVRRFQGEVFAAVGVPAPVTRVALADLDRDGQLDLVGAAPTAGRVVSVRLSDPRIGLGEATEILTGATAAGPDTIAVGDLDHDGWQDLALTRRSGPDTDRVGAVMTTPAADCDPTWSGPAEAPSFHAQLTDTRVADMDGDGRLDLIHASGGLDGAGGAQIAFGLGNGRFDSAPVELFSSQSPTDASAVGDLDADGLPDVAVLDGGRVRLWRQQSPTSFAEVNAPGLPDATRDLIVADLDLDRRDDLAWLHEDDDGTVRLHALLQLAPGAFSPAAISGAVIGAEASGLDVADLDADGRLDFVFVTRPPGGTGPAVCTWRWVGAASWESGFERCAPLGGAEAYYVDVKRAEGLADLDAGESPAYLVTVLDPEGVEVLQVRWQAEPGAGLFSEVEDDADPETTPPGYRLCAHTEGLVVAELDGDLASRDLALRCESEVAALLLVARVGRSFRGVPTARLGAWHHEGSLAAGDLDGDLRPDLIDGTTVFPRIAPRGLSFDDLVGGSVSPEGVWVETIAMGDLDGNGWLDAAAASGWSAGVHLSLQQPGGGLAVPITVGDAPVVGTDIVAGDLDGDGRVDLAYGAQAGYDNLVLLRHQEAAASGASLEVTTLPLDQLGTVPGQTIALGDVDGNALLDVGVLTGGDLAEPDDDRVVVRLQTSSGAFDGLLANADATFRSGTALLAAGRLRRVDAANAHEIGLAAAGACVSLERACVRVLGLTGGPATGLALSVVATVELAADLPVVGLAVVDMTGDGRDDVVVAQDDGGAVSLSVLVQSGAGGLTEQVTNASFGGRFRQMSVADLDRDGRVDLAVLVATYSQLGSREAVEVARNVTSSGGGGGVSFSEATRLESWGAPVDRLLTLDAARTGRPALVGFSASRQRVFVKR
jgi:hypothetical protein